MRYMGGKSRISKALSEVILAHTDKREVYVEPFVGGGAMAEKMAPHFETVVLNDLHEDLMLMWDAVLNKGWIPPTEVSEEEYKMLRNAEPSALRGFVGFGCSFGGKWFGGYAKRKYKEGTPQRNDAAESRRNVIKIASLVGEATCHTGSFHELVPWEGDVVYCDPPYEGTTGYKDGVFPHQLFWLTAQRWAEGGADVFVSEYTAPVGWEPIWEKEKQVSLDVATNSSKAIEKLFVWKGNK